VNPPADRFKFSSTTRGRRANAGFTLLELSIVIFIISIVAAFAIPALKQVSLRARASTVENDLRVFAAAFQAYAHDHGDWPGGDAVPGQFPPGMAGYLAKTNWERPSPIGGRYTWAPNSLQQGERYHAVVVISSVEGNPVTTEKNQLELIDRDMDDAALDTGNFRLGYRNFPVFVIEH
jgi:prepilin-type N-terminal cleavage/methylation domain-containing protein